MYLFLLCSIWLMMAYCHKFLLYQSYFKIVCISVGLSSFQVRIPFYHELFQILFRFLTNVIKTYVDIFHIFSC